jgi:hypothetical protein
MTFDWPTGAFPTPLTINNEPVFDLSESDALKLAVIEPGWKYRVSQLAGGWVVTSREPSEQS